MGYNEESFKIIPQIISSILPNETIELNLTLTIFNETIFEIIDFETDGFYETIEVNITYTENEEDVATPYLEENYPESTGYYCSELSNGKSCSAEEICSVDTVQTLDINNCCLGDCEIPEEGGFMWIGFLVGLIILVVLIIIGVKYKKSKNSKESKNPLESQVNKAETSNPIFSPKENP